MINRRNRNTVLVGKQEGRDHSEDLGIDRTVLQSISLKYGGRECKSFIWLTAGSEICLWIQ